MMEAFFADWRATIHAGKPIRLRGLGTFFMRTVAEEWRHEQQQKRYRRTPEYCEPAFTASPEFREFAGTAPPTPGVIKSRKRSRRT